LEQPSSPAHETWRAWLSDARREPFVVPDEVATGFLRVVTNRRVFATPSPVPDALGVLEALRARPGSRDPARPLSRWSRLEELCDATGARGPDLPDAWLAALAIEWSAVLVSADRGFARYPGLRWECPVG
jgi:toxin-antitoxin system PIN domain toxin